jgi:hypothetical protein
MLAKRYQSILPLATTHNLMTTVGMIIEQNELLAEKLELVNTTTKKKPIFNSHGT